MFNNEVSDEQDNQSGSAVLEGGRKVIVNS